MKIVIQNAPQGSVHVGGNIIGDENNGIVCLVGIGIDDTEEDLEWSVQKLLTFNLFPGQDGTQFQKSLSESRREILLVSQFTLFARLGNGRKLDFSRAMRNDNASAFFERFVERLKCLYDAQLTKVGSFGALMSVHILNDGPQTFIFDSKNR